MRYKRHGWFNDSYRHSLAAKGIRTSFKLKYGKDIPAQLHTGSMEFRKVDNIDNSKNSFLFKPDGGFWTSSYKHGDKYKSDWLEFDFKVTPGNILVRPIKNATVFEINDGEDVRFLFEKYGFVSTFGIPDLDWKKVSEDYDGLRVTSAAASRFHVRGVDVSDIVARKFPNKKEVLPTKEMLPNVDSEELKDLHSMLKAKEISLNAWDTESTVWFRDVFRKKSSREISVVKNE